MRIKIEVHSALGKFILPQGYNPYVQGLINACIPEDITWLGASAGDEEARFKLFTFSQLYAKSVERIDAAVAPGPEGGKGRVRYQLVFSSPVWFYLSSPSKPFIEALSRRLERARNLHLEHNLVEEIHVSETPTPVLPERGVVTWRIKMVSPVTVYQGSGKDADGKTRYFAPQDEPFVPVVLENAVRKYYAWTQQKASSADFGLVCLDRSPRLAIVTFKDTPIQGYTGRFELTGDAALLSFLYEVGLGGKNSHGFGMFDILTDQDKVHREETGEEHRAEGGGEKEESMQKKTPDRRGARREDRPWHQDGKRTEERWHGKDDRHGQQKRFSPPSPHTSRSSSHDHALQHHDEGPRYRFVSRYAPDIRPVGREKMANGSYSVWDGKPKTELPRFVRPDGTESTGGPRSPERRSTQRDHVAGGYRDERRGRQDQRHGRPGQSWSSRRSSGDSRQKGSRKDHSDHP